MRCKICKKAFIPNKYHPHQGVCSRAQCQHLRQVKNMHDWRIANPRYFEYQGQDESWRENRRIYSREWRKTHRDYLRKYEKSHRAQRRKYMREYMRRYRAAPQATTDKPEA